MREVTVLRCIFEECKNKAFFSYWGLKFHMNSYHLNDNICPVCKKRVNRLSYHMTSVMHKDILHALFSPFVSSRANSSEWKKLCKDKYMELFTERIVFDENDIFRGMTERGSIIVYCPLCKSEGRLVKTIDYIKRPLYVIVHDTHRCKVPYGNELWETLHEIRCRCRGLPPDRL